VRGGIITMVMGIIAIAIAFIIFPIVLEATGSVLAHTGNVMQTDTVTTGVAITEADVVLKYDLYEGDVANVVSITSTEATDVPVAASYVVATKTLTISGLIAEKTRDLTTTYETESMGVFTGLGSIVKVAPLMVFIGLLAGGGFGLFRGVTAMRGGGRRG